MKTKVNKINARKAAPKSLQNPKTRRLAIHAFCRECIYDPMAPMGWRGQIEACPSPKCPLYKFRPLSIAGEAERRAKKKVQ